jgi:hypothetical protein
VQSVSKKRVKTDAATTRRLAAALAPERSPPRRAIPDTHRRGAATVEPADQVAGHRRQSKSLKLEPIS